MQFIIYLLDVYTLSQPLFTLILITPTPPLISLPLLSIHPLLPKQHMYDVTSSAASLITQKISINHTHTHTHTHTYKHQHEYTHEMKHTHTYSNKHTYTISLIHSDILLNSFSCQLQSLIIFNHQNRNEYHRNFRIMTIGESQINNLWSKKILLKNINYQFL